MRFTDPSGNNAWDEIKKWWGKIGGDNSLLDMLTFSPNVWAPGASEAIKAELQNQTTGNSDPLFTINVGDVEIPGPSMHHLQMATQFGMVQQYDFLTSASLADDVVNMADDVIDFKPYEPKSFGWREKLRLKPFADKFKKLIKKSYGNKVKIDMTIPGNLDDALHVIDEAFPGLKQLDTYTHKNIGGNAWEIHPPEIRYLPDGTTTMSLAHIKYWFEGIMGHINYAIQDTAYDILLGQ